MYIMRKAPATLGTLLVVSCNSFHADVSHTNKGKIKPVRSAVAQGPVHVCSYCSVLGG